MLSEARANQGSGPYQVIADDTFNRERVAQSLQIRSRESGRWKNVTRVKASGHSDDVDCSSVTGWLLKILRWQDLIDKSFRCCAWVLRWIFQYWYLRSLYFLFLMSLCNFTSLIKSLIINISYCVCRKSQFWVGDFLSNCRHVCCCCPNDMLYHISCQE